MNGAGGRNGVREHEATFLGAIAQAFDEARDPELDGFQHALQARDAGLMRALVQTGELQEAADFAAGVQTETGRCVGGMARALGALGRRHAVDGEQKTRCAETLGALHRRTPGARLAAPGTTATRRRRPRADHSLLSRQWVTPWI
jgi:hypothetical protein